MNERMAVGLLLIILGRLLSGCWDGSHFQWHVVCRDESGVFYDKLVRGAASYRDGVTYVTEHDGSRVRLPTQRCMRTEVSMP